MIYYHIHIYFANILNYYEFKASCYIFDTDHYVQRLATAK